MGKVFWSFLFCLLGSLIITAAPATALTLSQSGVVTVSGIVPPAKRIIIDDTGKIQKIVSNCDIDAPLYAYLSDDMTIQTNLTDNIVRQYDFIKSTHNLNQLGTVYEATSAPTHKVKAEKQNGSVFQLSNLFTQNLFK